MLGWGAGEGGAGRTGGVKSESVGEERTTNFITLGPEQPGASRQRGPTSFLQPTQHKHSLTGGAVFQLCHVLHVAAMQHNLLMSNEQPWQPGP